MGEHRRGVVPEYDTGEQTGPMQALHSPVKPLMLLMYGAFALAGVAAAFFPSRAVTAHIDPVFTYVWAGFFLVGGLSCFFGAVAHSWAGEMVGLPLISSASLLYGAAVLVQYSDPSRRDGAFLFVGALLVAQGLSLAERWVSRWRLLRLAQRITQEGAP